MLSVGVVDVSAVEFVLVGSLGCRLRRFRSERVCEVLLFNSWCLREFFTLSGEGSSAGRSSKIILSIGGAGGTHFSTNYRLGDSLRASFEACGPGKFTGDYSLRQVS